MRKNRHFFLLLLMFVLSYSRAQNRYTDSLEALLKKTGRDTMRVKLKLDLAREYESSGRLKSFDYARSGYALADSIGDVKGKGRALNTLGDLYWFSGDYAAASNHYFRALKVFEDLGFEEGIGECYRNIGWIYQGQDNYELTLQYYQKSLDINLKLGLTDKLIPNYDDFAIVYKLMKNYPKAIEYSKKTLALAKDLKSDRGIATAYGNLGAIYFKMGNYTLAIESYELANKMHKDGNDHYNIAEAYLGLAESYLRLDQPDKAIRNAEEAMRIGKEYNFKTTLGASYHVLAFGYAMKKNYEQACEYMQQFGFLQDSTYNEQNSKQINEMSAKYESDKKELLISSLEKDKKLSDEKLEREKNFKIYLGIFCLLVAGFAFMLFRGNVQKKKANNSLSLAYKEIEVKNKDITDSINYSKRIQEATLPPKELKYKLFPDAFVLFRPKDIVSGDFYWYAEKDGKRLIAACDCTGHGVPGALMSMIGNNILNQIVNEKGITSAAGILNHLHMEIRKALKQQEQVENRDGMDIALAIFNSDNDICFAGAQRPLWILRKDAENVEEIRGNKFSIGGLQTEEDRKFTEHRIILEKGDSVYLFSDGYVDQFGGKDGKKFMTKNFRQLLMSIHNEPMARQELVIEGTMNKWMDKREQVDDILVIGVRC